MQRIIATCAFGFLIITSALAQSGIVNSPLKDPPAWQKGISGPFPVDQTTATHPIGLWVLEGSDCHTDDMTAIQIDDTTITFYDPTAHSGSFTTENGGSFEITDLSVQVAVITSAEPSDAGQHFVAERDDGTIDNFTLELLPEQKATLTFEDGFSLPLTACGQD